MSRQTYILGLGIALVTLAFVLTDELVPGTPGVTKRNARRIQPGMTPGEVEGILGLQSGTGGCIAMPGFYPWWQVKTILTNLADPQRLQQFLEREHLADPNRFAGEYGTAEFYRDASASEKGLEVGFLSKAEGGWVLVYFGEAGRVRRARWLPDEHVRKTFVPKTTLLDRLRSWLCW